MRSVMSGSTIQLAILILVFISTILIADGLIRYAASKTSYKKIKNKRLKVLEKIDLHEEALAELRRGRGLSSEGRYLLPIKSFNNLLLQSGLTIGVKKLIFYMFILGLTSFIMVYFFEKGYIFSSMAFIGFGIVLPILWLLNLRSRRRKKIEGQLPESIDVLKRSLNAGHPLPVAIKLVASEMPDPIGSEFGITSDEMIFGLDLETALTNMGARIGQADMSLLVVSVSIQSKTGGNLTELLYNISKVIRTRQTLRRKVRALSSEGRFSAIALSILPWFLFAVLLVIAPSFYGDVWGHELIKPMLGFGVVWATIGDFIMYRMVNFKY